MNSENNCYAALTELPLPAIQPEGWLRRYLELQRDGLTGHLENAGHPFNDPAISWTELRDLDRDASFWGYYEQNAYWIDGMMRAGGLLRDDFLTEKAAAYVRHVLDHADEDGYLGPLFLKAAPDSGSDLYTRWSHAIFFRAMAAYYDVTGDEAVLTALSRHFLESEYDYSTGRNVCNIEAMVWLYEKTGDPALLSLAEETFLEMDRKGVFPDESSELRFSWMLRDSFADCHGVSYCEVGKLGAILYRVTGKRLYLDISESVIRKLERYSMLIDGVPSSAEFMQGRGALDSHETCVITDFTWAAGHVLMASGDSKYADMIEKAMLNALPGAVDGDFKALQYFSSPNQVIVDGNSNHNLFCQGMSYMAYRPNPGTECCPGNVNRAMPNYAARMWMRAAAGGIAAVLYGASTVSFDVDGVPVSITEETDYPFDETIRFTIRLDGAKEVCFPLIMRVPGWCEGAVVSVNGKPVKEQPATGSFFAITRDFADGDVIELRLPMKIRVSRWPRGGAGVERGPLVYALKIGEDWQVDETDERSTPEFPGYKLYATTPWNYALVLPREDPTRHMNLVARGMSDKPFTSEGAPLEIHALARRLPGWDYRRETEIVENHIPFSVVTKERLATQPVRTGEFAFTPELPAPGKIAAMAADETEVVTLVPYGCARLRVSVFPVVEG